MTAGVEESSWMSAADRAAFEGKGAAVAQAASWSPSVSTPTFALASGQRELRLDLFRGLALWLIYIDHVSPDLLTWLTIRNYGFSDAAEIFIFISGFTAALVYGRATLEAGFLIGTARMLRRVWQIYTAHLLLFLVLMAEIAYVVAVSEKPSFYIQEMEVANFFKEPGPMMIQALLLRFRPLNMDVLPLYVVLMAFLPLVLLLARLHSDLPLALRSCSTPLRSGSISICRRMGKASGRSIRVRGSCFSCLAPGARWGADDGSRRFSIPHSSSGRP